MSRARPHLVALPALALLAGCQLLIGLDGGKPQGTGGAGGATSTSSSSSATTGSTTASGTGGTGGASGAGGTGGATSSASSSSSSSGASCDAGACGGPCAPCPTVVLLAGGAPGPNGVLAGVYAPGGAWTTTALAGTTEETAVAFVPATGDGIGVVRSPAPGNQLQHTRYDGATWTALAALNADAAQGQPALAAAGTKAHLVFWDTSFMHAHETWSGGAWSASPQPVTPAGTGSQPCGPNAPALAPLGAEVSVAFVNGSCTGPLNHLLGADLAGGAWQASADISDSPSYAASQRPALAAPAPPGPELVAAYVQQGTQQIVAATRSGGVWSAPAPITNGLTDDPVALAPLADGGAVLAYRGTDGKLYYATYTGAWSTPAAAFSPANVSIAATPAVAHGVGTARAELAYVDGNGVAFHTRLVGATWSAPVQVATATGFTHIAVASGP